MEKWSRRAIGALATGITLLVTANASALLLEKAGGDGGLSEFTHFYPYPTSYTYVDDNYDFDDDPLTAFIKEPYFMPVVVQHVTVRRAMVRPRATFVEKMVQSTEAI
ncbi:MAG: hypothetical protein DRI90_03495 [Deltaproteobacteria bacterium]|nr:MAG: hypothetical protein DRI90_03495 [Deltaproteobacteria bacterium]